MMQEMQEQQQEGENYFFYQIPVYNITDFQMCVLYFATMLLI